MARPGCDTARHRTSAGALEAMNGLTVGLTVMARFDSTRSRNPSGGRAKPPPQPPRDARPTLKPEGTMHRRQRLVVSRLALAFAFVAAALPLVDSPAAAAPYDEATFQALDFRLVGPFRGGRSTAVTGVPGQPRTFYMGTTGGGVWKTTDGGA